MNINRFNVRVYGILLLDGKVLVTDELVKGRAVTKFPGGGLEYGEGTIDCLKREFMEEAGHEVEIISHFYTTDFFQQSAFDASQQIISIYYLVSPPPEFKLETSEEKFKFKNLDCVFRWIALKEISEDDVSLPIDKIVAGMLKKKYA